MWFIILVCGALVGYAIGLLIGYEIKPYTRRFIVQYEFEVRVPCLSLSSPTE